MKKLIKIAVLLILSAICQSCYTMRYAVDEPSIIYEYSGKTYTQIIEKLGPPTRMIPDGKGGNILVYELGGNIYTEGYINSYGSISSTSIKDNSYIHLYLNDKGICYDVKTKILRKEKDPAATRVAVALSVFLSVIFGTAMAQVGAN